MTRPYVWNANYRGCFTFTFPWRVTVGRPKGINNFMSSFATFEEALEFANRYAA